MSKPPPEPLFTFRGTMSPIHCLIVVIKGDNEILYAGTSEGYVHVWDLKTKRQLTRHNVGNEACICILYNNFSFVTQQKADSIKFWIEENNSWKLVKVIRNEYCGFCNLSLLDDFIFLPDNDGRVIIYDFIKNKEIHLEEKKTFGQLMCSKSIKSLGCILLVYETGDIQICNKKMEVLSSSKFSSDCPMAVDVCEATKEGVLGTSSETFFKFTIDEKLFSIEKVKEGNLTNAGIGCISINEEGTLCALGCWDGRIRYYSMKKLKLLAVLIHHTECIQCITFVNKELSFCGNGLVAAGGKDTRISLWNLYTSKTNKV